GPGGTRPGAGPRPGSGDRPLRPSQLATKRDIRGPELDDRVRPLLPKERRLAPGSAWVQARIHLGRAAPARRQVSPVPLAAIDEGRAREGGEESAGAVWRVAIPDPRAGALLAGVSRDHGQG